METIDPFAKDWGRPQTQMLMTCLAAHWETYGTKGWFYFKDVVRFKDCVMIVTGATYRSDAGDDWPSVFDKQGSQQTIPRWKLYESDEDVPCYLQTNLSSPKLTFDCNGPQ